MACFGTPPLCGGEFLWIQRYQCPCDRSGIFGSPAKPGWKTEKGRDTDPGCQPFWSGLEEVNDSFDFEIYPNPTSNNFNLSFNLNEDQMLNAEMIDIRGKKVKEIANSRYSAGQHVITISTDDLQKGLYLIRLVAESEIAIKNLLIVE